MADRPSWTTAAPLARRAVTTPDRSALVDLTDTDSDSREAWTYATLDSLVERVVADLRERLPDSPPQRRLGLALSPRLGFVTALYATRRLGWTAVLLDPGTTSRELRQRVEQTDAAALLCERRSEAVCRETGLPVVSVDATDNESVPSLLAPVDSAGDGDGATSGSDRTARTLTSSDERAQLILFTSGTTGEPKAVRLTATNLFSSAVASAFRLGVTPDDRWLGCLPVHHMGGLAPVFRSAWYGTTLVMQGGFDAADTARLLDQENITGVSLVPTQLRRLLDAGWSPSESLRTVLLGGAPAGESLLERALDAGVPVHPTYGLTEAASQVTTARPADVRADIETVGQPLCWTDVRIVADGEPAEADEEGEIVVDGPTVTPGYLDEGATADAFSEWGLHTGDLGVRDEHGRLRVHGRLDDVINTGGELVAPAEVADVLESHPGVEVAAVVGLADEEWGERVAALVVPADSSALQVDDIRNHCRDRLAAYKRPKTVETADELPRTDSGTVDRPAVVETLRHSRR
jgi:O-succinylbenzoic acid--CoA ligase